MKKQIEVEVRGRIKNFDEVLKKFKEKAKFIEEKDRFSLGYYREDVPKDIREIKDEKLDLRLRITNKKPEMIIKYGVWGGSDSRKEISIPLPQDKFDDALEFLNCLNWNKGVIMATKTFVFEYKGIEFALVKYINGKNSNYFEAEKIIEKEEDAEMTRQEIEKLCNQLGLNIFNDDEFIDMCNKLNSKEGNLFDFSKQKFEDIKEKFKEFF